MTGVQTCALPISNHFDPETQRIIGENLRDYSGTIIMVSHNPAFVEQIGITRMLVVPSQKNAQKTAQKTTQNPASPSTQNLTKNSAKNPSLALIKNYSRDLLEYYYYLNTDLV